MISTIFRRSSTIRHQIFSVCTKHTHVAFMHTTLSRFSDVTAEKSNSSSYASFELNEEEREEMESVMVAQPFKLNAKVQLIQKPTKVFITESTPLLNTLVKY